MAEEGVGATVKVARSCVSEDISCLFQHGTLGVGQGVVTVAQLIWRFLWWFWDEVRELS